MANQLIEVELNRSSIGCTEKQKANLRGIGLRRPGHTVFRKDTPAFRGMLKKVIHLVSVKRAAELPKEVKPVSFYEVKAVKATAKKAPAVKKTATTKKATSTKKEEKK